MKGAGTPSSHTIFSSCFWDNPWPAYKSSLENTVAEICTNSKSIFWFHKGFWILGRTFLTDMICRQLCEPKPFRRLGEEQLVPKSQISFVATKNVQFWSRVLLLHGIQITGPVWNSATGTSLTCPLPPLPHSRLVSFSCALFRKPSSCCWAATKTPESPSSKAETNLMWRFSDLHL